MAIVVVNEGAGQLLRYTIGLDDVDGGPNWILRLNQNNVSVVPGTVLGDFAECDFTGYNEQSLSPTSWGSPSIISNRASSTYAPGTPFDFTNTGSAQAVYGYYVVLTSLGICLFAEQFATPRTLLPGDTLELTLNFTGGTQL